MDIIYNQINLKLSSQCVAIYAFRKYFIVIFKCLYIYVNNANSYFDHFCIK